MSLGVVFHAPGLRHVAIVRDPRPLAAFADSPVADTAETVTPQPVVTRSDFDGDDGHAMGHSEIIAP